MESEAIRSELPRPEVPAIPPRPALWRRFRWVTLSVLGIVVLATSGYLFMCSIADNGVAVEKLPEQANSGNTAADQNPDKGAGETPPSPNFIGWGKPELAIVITGQMHGYLQPCGCSRPQLGGLARRYNFIKSLKDKGWPVVALDVGELAQANGPQAKLKYEFSMRALNLMNYSAVGLGKTEFNTPLFEALARYSLENKDPTPIASNVKKVEMGQELHDMNVRRYKVIETGAKVPKLCVFSIVDPMRQQEVTDPDVKFLASDVELTALLKQTQPQRAINVLLYQGNDSDPGLATLLKNNPSIAIVLCLSSDSEPPSRMKVLEGSKAQVITVGHKGRYVGVVGLFQAAKGYQPKYDLISIGEQYETPKGKEAENPVISLMQKYADTVHDQNFIAKFPRGPHPLEIELKAKGIATKYAGSAACSNCHEQEHQIWTSQQGEKVHSKAYDSLVKADRPNLRQFDGECLVCHTVGFQNTSGFAHAGNMAKLNENLKNVGCESCHGPASAHANAPDNKEFYPLINPLSTQRIPANAGDGPLKQAFIAKQLRKQDDFCQKCHDPENDVHWGNVPFAQKWKQIDHIRPRAGAGAAVGNRPAEDVRVEPDPKKK